MPGNDNTAPAEAFSLLYVTASQIATVPSLTETARRIGADTGIDYLSDPEVALMLYRHQTLIDKMNSRGIWGALLFGPAALGIGILISTTDWDQTDPVVSLVLFTPLVLLLMASTYLLLRAFGFRRQWVHTGTRDQVNGYLQVLAAAGLPPQEIPAWLRPAAGKRWR